MNRRYYSKRHFDRISNGAPDTTDQALERIRYRAAAEQAHSETMAKFAPLTAANAATAMAWQEQRIKELLSTPPCLR